LYRGAYYGGSLESKLLHVTLLALEFFWKICASLFYVIASMESYSNYLFTNIKMYVSAGYYCHLIQQMYTVVCICWLTLW
jgi:hypothetical protein